MKKIGIIGGIGPESTLDYYRGIIDGVRRKSGDELHYPDIVIFSADLIDLIRILEDDATDELAEWLLNRIAALQRAGADFAAIASNAPHMVFEEVMTRSPLPLLSIVEETCRKAESLGVKRVGLMGTKFTMEADFFQRPFLERGMTVVVPAADEQKYIHDKLFSEIELGIIKDSTRKGLLAIAEKMAARDGIEAMILGCTELPLILNRAQFGIPYLNTTAIHVEGIVRHCLAP